MAKVKIEEIVDHLSSEMQSALRAALNEVAPAANVDEHTLYRAFKRAVGRKCGIWERVPDRYVEKE
jgi:transcriptional regulator GlxA family with amidase domain